VADIQTGFGPFLAIYLTTQKWNQADIGLVLSIGSLAGLACQLPGGWIVDVVRSKRNAALLAVIAIGASALLIALSPVFLTIVLAKLLHVGASSVLGPAIAAITLGLVGYAAAGPRLGRNARFAAIGNALAAGVMGACGYLISPQAVFYVTALLAIPAAAALLQIRDSEIDPIRADAGNATDPGVPLTAGIAALLQSRALVVLALAVFLFHAANAAMLPLVGAEMTIRSGQWASVLIAVCIIAPQFVVALIAPRIGQWAAVGRRPILLLGFAALPARAALLAVSSDPATIVVVQLLDGICAAVLGVLLPLCLADIAQGTGRFNLAQGIIASVTGVGAAASTTLAGYAAHRFGAPVAFLCLTAIAVSAVAVIFVAMPETLRRNVEA
jgi:MFS family permease